MEKAIAKAIFNKIETIIYDKKTSVNEKVEVLTNFFNKNKDNLSFWSKENLLDAEVLETIIFEYEKPKPIAEEENKKSPFYEVSKDIAKAEYQKFINDFTDFIFTDRKKEAEKEMEKLIDFMENIKPDLTDLFEGLEIKEMTKWEIFKEKIDDFIEGFKNIFR